MNTHVVLSRLCCDSNNYYKSITGHLTYYLCTDEAPDIKERRTTPLYKQRIDISKSYYILK